MREAEYMERWDAIIDRYKAEMTLTHVTTKEGKNYYVFCCTNPPIEIDVSPTLTPEQRQIIIDRAEAMIPIWDKMYKKP